MKRYITLALAGIFVLFVATTVVRNGLRIVNNNKTLTVVNNNDGYVMDSDTTITIKSLDTIYADGTDLYFNDGANGTQSLSDLISGSTGSSSNTEILFNNLDTVDGDPAHYIIGPAMYVGLLISSLGITTTEGTSIVSDGFVAGDSLGVYGGGASDPFTGIIKDANGNGYLQIGGTDSLNVYAKQLLDLLSGGGGSSSPFDTVTVTQKLTIEDTLLVESPGGAIYFDDADTYIQELADSIFIYSGLSRIVKVDENGMGLPNTKFLYLHENNENYIYVDSNEEMHIVTENADIIRVQGDRLRMNANYGVQLMREIASTANPNLTSRLFDNSGFAMHADTIRAIHKSNQIWHSWDKFYLDYITSDPDTQWVYLAPDGSLGADSLALAGHGLLDSLPNIHEYLANTQDGELYWYNRYGLHKTPGKAIEQLMWMDEHNLRYVADLEKRVEELENRVAYLENCNPGLQYLRDHELEHKVAQMESRTTVFFILLAVVLVWLVIFIYTNYRRR